MSESGGKSSVEATLLKALLEELQQMTPKSDPVDPRSHIGGAFEVPADPVTVTGKITSGSWVNYDRTTKAYHRFAAFKVELRNVDPMFGLAKESEVETSLRAAAHILHCQRNKVETPKDLETEEEEWSKNISDLAKQSVVNTDNRFSLQHTSGHLTGHGSMAVFDSTSSEPTLDPSPDHCQKVSLALYRAASQGEQPSRAEKADMKAWMDARPKGDPIFTALLIASPGVYEIDREARH